MKLDFTLEELTLLLVGVDELEKKIKQLIIDCPVDDKRQMRERVVGQLEQISDKLAVAVDEY